MAQVEMAQLDMVRTRRSQIEMGENAMQQTRLLGFAPLEGLDALLAAMRAVPGPELLVHRAPHTASRGGPGVAALFQTEPDVPLMERGREALAASLGTVQRRLEVACQAGPFLPMDPAAACCPAAAAPLLLASAWDALTPALARHGAHHQWDIVLSWTPEHVVARHRGEIAPAAASGPAALAEAVAGVLRNERGRREAALLAALAPAVLALAAGGAAGTETQVAVTVLVASGCEAPVEAALDAMAAEHVENATIDMRGPLPPLSFFSVKIATVEEQAVTSAWSTLGLGDRVDLSDLHRQWRLRAAAAHPDRQHAPETAGSGATVSDLTDAYRLLRDLLPAGTDAEGHTLHGLLRRAGYRLIMPADIAAPVRPVQRAGVATAAALPESLLERLP